ncbi:MULTISPECIES: cytochrome oxidase putative small subunit CydP [unclassified Hahella]|uniref:cytochrome oxidase putative small subunit CydP n=1 Tax=unclassified Hahella TaxID=2624107 RepID=UPI000FDCEE76|nr:MULTISPECIES: cytochrome oxidase putative small subunit CydP [unclassified Hahella]AZZ94269.1 hypothetical protein ENC22_24940 [Hahella sp. KA22]MBU6953089.1 hypothetical protein [Hahella sp. HN01]MDG9669922.1 hypothetical protein [Hahella sp. CR1]QAY57643.1 hypothetical protein EUZ85_27525 [Hahella sp. KA22]
MPERKSIFSIPLVRELSLFLLLKLILIFAIKAAYFSDPVDLSHPEESISKQFGVIPTQSEDHYDQ